MTDQLFRKLKSGAALA